MVVLNALDDEGWQEFRTVAATAFPEQFPGAKPDADSFGEERKMLMGRKWAMAYFCPRGAGPTSWATLSPVKQNQLRRRLLLLGESLDSGRVWDITRAAAALRARPGFDKTPLWLQAQKIMAANTLYASLFIPEVKRLDLHGLLRHPARRPDLFKRPAASRSAASRGHGRRALDPSALYCRGRAMGIRPLRRRSVESRGQACANPAAA